MPKQIIVRAYGELTFMETYFTFANLHKAYLDCRNGKTETKYHLQFFENLEKNLLLLERELQSRTYKPGRSIAFVVQKPKIREIFAADFRDRVVHHLLYNYLSPIFERYFIYDSWACRKGKGTHRAMLRLVEFARKLERERERERNLPTPLSSRPSAPLGRAEGSLA